MIDPTIQELLNSITISYERYEDQYPEKNRWTITQLVAFIDNLLMIHPELLPDYQEFINVLDSL